MAKDAAITKKDLNQTVDKAVDELTNVIRDFAGAVDKRFEQVDKRFEQVDKRFEQVDKRFDKIEHDIAELRKDFNRMMLALDANAKRLEELYQEMIARDAKIERLERWIHKIAQETGIKLDL